MASSTSNKNKDLHFLQGQVWPRRRELLRSKSFWLALVIAPIATMLVFQSPGGSIPISEAASAGLTFSSISFGACFSATLLAIGLPGAQRIKNWSTASGSVDGKSVLSDLIFVLVWAALSQVALVITCSLALIMGGNIPTAPLSPLLTHTLLLSISLFVFIYAILELLIVVQTISQIGVVIIAEENRRHKEE